MVTRFYEFLFGYSVRIFFWFVVVWVGFVLYQHFNFFPFFYNVIFSQINPAVSMGSLSCLGSIKKQQSMAAIIRTTRDIFQISDKYTCTMITQTHWFIHCYAYQKRKQVYRIYKLNLSFHYYFSITLVTWGILDQDKENYSTFRELCLSLLVPCFKKIIWLQIV